MSNVLITGCSSGIGRALADAFKNAGYEVWASARRVEDVDRGAAAQRAVGNAAEEAVRAEWCVVMTNVQPANESTPLKIIWASSSKTVSSHIEPVPTRELRVYQRSSLTITVQVIPAANSTPSGTSSM